MPKPMDTRPFSAAAERNREPILAVLKSVLPDQGHALQIGSGTAQHVTLFARELPDWQWQPSERPETLAELQAGLGPLEDRPDNIQSPIALDVAAAWPNHRYDAIFSANTAHIMSWPEVEALFAGVARHLTDHGVFVLYGPFRFGGRILAESNAAFDQSLRLRDRAMGLRDVPMLDKLADSLGLTRSAELAMPANNHILLFHPSLQEI